MNQLIPLTKEIHQLFGLRVWPFEKTRLLQLIDLAAEKKHSQLIFPLNSQAIYLLYHSPLYYQAMKQADIVYADGFSITLAGKLLGKPIAERIPTTDLIIHLMEFLTQYKKNHRIFFLGATKKVLEKAFSFFRSRYPKVNLVGHYAPPFLSLEEMRQKENDKIIKMINSLEIDILFVALGIPKQEIWCWQNRHKINASVFLPCGGLFSYYAGEVKRAPEWIQRLGLEWSFRLLQEPRRLGKRYLLSNSLFFWYVLKEFLKESK